MFSAGNDNGNTGVNGNNTGSIALSGTLDAVERSLQTLTYKAAAAGNTSIDVFVSDWAGISTTATIPVFNNAAPLQFNWNNANGGSFGDVANWTAAPHSAPPGGANIASFGAGTYTVSGDGAVAQIMATGTTTLTGQVTAQGRGGLAMSVDGGGALTLAGGAQLTVKQEAIVGEAGQGLLVVMGGALDLSGPAAATALVIGQQSGSGGTVVNLEQITANGTVIVGGAGTGALELLGVASSVSDGGADIGQFAGGHGSVTVNGGEWMNGGLLTVGDAGTGSLLINGTNGGITGQVTAFNAAIGNQAGGQGSVTLNAGEFLVANVAAASSTLAVGGAGTGELVGRGRQRGRRRRRPGHHRQQQRPARGGRHRGRPGPRPHRRQQRAAGVRRCRGRRRGGIRGVRQQCRRQRPVTARSRSARAPTTSPCSRCWERSASPAPARSRWAAATPPCAPAPSTSPRVGRSPARARCRAWAAAIAR